MFLQRSLTKLCLALVVFAPLIPALAQDDFGSIEAAEISQMSIEELVNLEVTSPSKKPERFSDVASAIYVITQDDIRRSGATSIPEILRMVPGLGVLKIDESQWAISSRGFTGVF